VDKNSICYGTDVLFFVLSRILFNKHIGNCKLVIKHFVLTLYDPRFLTEQPSLTLRPAGTVTFSMYSVNSGSSTTTVKHNILREKTFKNEFILI